MPCGRTFDRLIENGYGSMKLKYDFVSNKVADSVIAVAVGEDISSFNSFIKLNETGAFIFNLLKNEISREEILACLKEEYNAPEKELEIELDAFIEELKKAEVLD